MTASGAVQSKCTGSVCSRKKGLIAPRLDNQGDPLASYIDMFTSEPPGRRACFIEVENALRYGVDVRD
jgi:hypothetical protein